MKSLAILLLASVWLGVICGHDDGAIFTEATLHGFIRIKISSADLSAEHDNVHASFCLMESLKNISSPVPDRSKCSVYSSTTKIHNTTKPVWNKTFLDSHINFFLRDSRVIFEIYDSQSKETSNVGANDHFVGAASVTIPDLLDHGNNNKTIQLDIAGDKQTEGKIHFSIEWKPYNPPQIL